MRSPRRAQSSLEFLLLAGATLVGLTFVIVSAQSILLAVRHDNAEAQAASVASALQRELNLARNAQSGYERTFMLPTSIDGVVYTITIIEESPPAEDAIVVSWQNTTRTTFVEQNITGTLIPGENSLRKAGTIYLNS